MHKAWHSKEEVPYCFSRSSIKFWGHTRQKITSFDPNWAFPDCNSSLNSPMALKWCTMFDIVNRQFESSYSKITWPVAVNKSLRFASFISYHLRTEELDLYMTLTFDPITLTLAKFLNRDISRTGGSIDIERMELGQAILSSDKASLYLLIWRTKLFEVTKWSCMQRKVDLVAPDSPCSEW